MSVPAPLLLAADIGATNCRLALFRGEELEDLQVVPTAGPGLEEVLAEVLPGLRPDAACIAVAGPVRAGKARLTNQGWELDEARLSEVLACPVALVNDFHAAARGTTALSPAGYTRVQGPPVDPAGLRAVLGPGSGLGQALLLPDGAGLRVQATEGGHADFAPGNEQERALQAWLARRYGHVSYERVLSGPGLMDLQNFLVDQGLPGPRATTPAQAGEGQDQASVQARAVFARVLGAQAGNLALTTSPSGGVWICGGVLPRLPRDQVLPPLLSGWADKGRFGEMMAEFPLLIVEDPLLGIRGAGAEASRLLRARGV